MLKRAASIQSEKIGDIIFLNEDDKLPDHCIEPNGDILSKQSYPELWEIFKGCKCFNVQKHKDYSPDETKDKHSEFFHLPVPKTGTRLAIIYK